MIGIVIFILLLLFLVLCILSVIYFKNCKTSENKVLFQTLPITYLLLTALILSETPIGSVSEGYALGFGYFVPGIFIVVIYQIIVGIMGIVYANREKTKQTLLLVTSIISLLSLLAVPIFMVAFVILFFVMIGRKVVEKYKKK